MNQEKNPMNDNDLSPPVERAGAGRLFIVSAPSGGGKTTICRRLLRRFPGLRYSVSYTTRHPRRGEIPGTDYHFISRRAFLEGIEKNRWAEWAEVHGNYYGSSAEFIERETAAGRDVLLDIDVQGARQIMARYPDCVSIFIAPPSMQVLEERLRGRGTDSEHTITLRLKNAEAEMAEKDRYRYVVVNDDLQTAMSAMESIISTHCAGCRAAAGPVDP